MSLVGPRPHALPITGHYEELIRLYARRPQREAGHHRLGTVNGPRGETRAVRDMQRRVEHDFHYIDHWSLILDVKILVLTVLSPKTYRERLLGSTAMQMKFDNRDGEATAPPASFRSAIQKPKRNFLRLAWLVRRSRLIAIRRIYYVRVWKMHIDPTAWFSCVEFDRTHPEWNSST